MSIFYQGQAVGCLMYGEGIVKAIIDHEKYKVLVQLEHCNSTYTESGQYHSNARPTLYPLEQYRAIIANLPARQPEAWKPKPGEWCWFWDNRDTSKFQPVLSQFKQMVDDMYQATLYKWEQCAPFIGELPEHLKEVQP